jgi:glycerol uptake facilitator-like aquaporin
MLKWTRIIGALPVAILVWVKSWGTTGYAINPARDLGPNCTFLTSGNSD